MHPKKRWTRGSQWLARSSDLEAHGGAYAFRHSEATSAYGAKREADGQWAYFAEIAHAIERF